MAEKDIAAGSVMDVSVVLEEVLKITPTTMD